MLKKEIRALEFEVRAGEDEHPGRITGRAIVAGKRTNLGPFDEIIDAGALRKTDLRDVRLLVNHNTDMVPLARSRNNTENSTMQLMVDAEGNMDMRADLDIEQNADASALCSAIERGDISGMSFMMTVRGESWEDINSNHPTRHITDIERVYEVSAVTWPAYTATRIHARGLPDALESAEAALESERTRIREIENKKRKIKILMEG